MVYYECHASQVPDQRGRPLWLFHPNTVFWKNWLQERLQSDPFTASERTPQSLALFDPPGDDPKYHIPFAKSTVSERLEHIPLPGKGFKTAWTVIDRNNNHWLDAAGYACAAGGVLGVRIVPTVQAQPKEPVQPRQHSQPTKPADSRFRSRPGGWVPRRRTR
jgi:hypothetical protein